MTKNKNIIDNSLINKIKEEINNNEKIFFAVKDNLKVFLDYCSQINKKKNCFENYNSLEEILKTYDKVQNYQQKNFIREKCGGYLNHLYFFLSLKKKEKINESSEFYLELKKEFKDFNAFANLMKKKASRLFGSGWVWLVLHEKKLKIVVFFNEDNPWYAGFKPLIAIDLWEHAYFSKFNTREEYIDFILDNLDYQFIENLYLAWKNEKNIEISKL